MQIYNNCSSETTYTSSERPVLKNSVAPDFRSQLLQNQEAPTPCCLGSCLIKIKDLFVALFSWLFCCKSESSLDAAKRTLREFVDGLKSEGVVARMDAIIADLNSLASGEDIEDREEIEKRLPRPFIFYRPKTQLPDCENWIKFCRVAEMITEPNFSENDVDQLMDDPSGKVIIELLIKKGFRISDSTARLQKLVLGMDIYLHGKDGSFDDCLQTLREHIKLRPTYL